MSGTTRRWMRGCSRLTAIVGIGAVCWNTWACTPTDNVANGGVVARYMDGSP